MRLINKTQPPTSLIRYSQQTAASYDEMDKDVKDELRDSLIAEQFGVCAYCQQKLKKGITIEHHCERSICNGQNSTVDKRLDYQNLFAVCPGVGGKPSETHCDTKKAEKAQNPSANGLPMTIIPTNLAHINSIRYSSNGRISSNLYDEELNELLNLNAPYLREMRKRKWLYIFNKSKSGAIINKVKMSRLIERDLSLIDGKFANPLPGLSEYMKIKFC